MAIVIFSKGITIFKSSLAIRMPSSLNIHIYGYIILFFFLVCHKVTCYNMTCEEETMKKKKIQKLISFTLLLILDQVSKAFMRSILKSKSIIIIPNFFKLELAFNTGGAWSILNGNVGALILLNILILFIFFKMSSKIKETRLKSISYVCLIAGTVGNLLDRIFYGAVTDFLSFNFWGYHYPIFNLADIMIVVGAFLLILTLESR